MTRKITRKELIKALESIGVHVAQGKGKAAYQQFGHASIVGLDMRGEHIKLNGESNDSYICLIVEVQNVK